MAATDLKFTKAPQPTQPTILRFNEGEAPFGYEYIPALRLHDGASFVQSIPYVRKASGSFARATPYVLRHGLWMQSPDEKLVLKDYSVLADRFDWNPTVFAKKGWAEYQTGDWQFFNSYARTAIGSGPGIARLYFDPQDYQPGMWARLAITADKDPSTGFSSYFSGRIYNGGTMVLQGTTVAPLTGTPRTATVARKILDTDDPTGWWLGVAHEGSSAALFIRDLEVTLGWLPVQRDPSLANLTVALNNIYRDTAIALGWTTGAWGSSVGTQGNTPAAQSGFPYMYVEVYAYPGETLTISGELTRAWAAQGYGSLTIYTSDFHPDGKALCVESTRNTVTSWTSHTASYVVPEGKEGLYQLGLDDSAGDSAGTWFRNLELSIT